MLASTGRYSSQSGTLATDVHLSGAALGELLEFIIQELPRWRDRSDRDGVSGETRLTSQLCAHLSSAARHSGGWDILQFRVEEADSRNASRKVDLVLAPRGVTIWIDGRSYVDFDTLLPIECKRLPTPKDRRRDEREYVTSRLTTTGGIQRFKAGHHGATHRLGAMIGYIQKKSRKYWRAKVEEWITELARTGKGGWSAADGLELDSEDEKLRLDVLRSSHARANGLSAIELRHVWIEMN